MKKESNIKRLLSFGKGYERLTVLGCILAGVSEIFALIPYYYIWKIIKEIFLPNGGISNYSAMIHYGWMAVIFAIIYIGVYFTGLMCTHISAFHIAGNIRTYGMEHLLSLPLGYFDGKESGTLRKIIDDNANLTEDMLAHKLADSAASMVTPVVSIVFLFLFDWKMGLICLGFMVASALMIATMMTGESKEFFKKYIAANEKMAGEAVEYVRGIPVVKTFQQTIYSFKSFHKAIEEGGNMAYEYAMTWRVKQAFFLTFITGPFVILIPMALFMASGGGLAAGHVLVNFIFYTIFAPACGGTINRLMYASQAFYNAQEAVYKLDQILKVKPQEESGESIKPKDNSVEFRDVHFAYSKDEKEVIKGLNFKANEGELTAVVGPSGGGKSTAAGLIPRLYDVGSGEVKIGGINVNSLNFNVLMDEVSLVFQSSSLFKMSIRDNLLIGRENASEEEIKIGLRAASCEDIIDKLPNGLDTIIGSKGVYLSGGEVQRIALARVFIKNSPVIILDEATAFADPDNEYMIQKSLSEMVKGKTVIMIAHRLSTIQNADKILVIQDGMVVEEGNHEELLEKSGLYSHMWEDYIKSARWKISVEGGE